jgi:DUF1680 family protein
VVRRRWRAGDTLELDLPMAARLMTAHPLVEEDRNHVAVMRGPLVYCLESHEVADDVHVTDVALPRDLVLRPAPATHGPLAGMTLLRGTGLLRREEHGFDSPLYHELSTVAPQEIALTLIPYFAWANRGASEMSVWLPLAS